MYSMSLVYRYDNDTVFQRILVRNMNIDEIIV